MRNLILETINDGLLSGGAAAYRKLSKVFGRRRYPLEKKGKDLLCVNV